MKIYSSVYLQYFHEKIRDDIFAKYQTLIGLMND